MATTQFEQELADLRAIEEMQEIGLRMRARRGLTSALTRAAMHNIDVNIMHAQQYIICTEALAFVEAERNLSDAQRADVRVLANQLTPNLFPGAQAAAARRAAPLPPSSKVASAPRALPAPSSFNRQIEGLTQTASSVADRVEEDEEEYARVASFLGRRAL